MSSKTTSSKDAYVWIWLPDTVEPVVAGRISQHADQHLFNYGQSYLVRENAIALNAWELPLKPGITAPLSELTLAGCLCDGSPGEWGRRTLINYLSNKTEPITDLSNTNELVFLLHSGSNRIGSLDFQHSAQQYQPRINDNTTLEELIVSIRRAENNTPLTEEKDKALIYGSSLGGKRPKALITIDSKQYVAKFSSRSDTLPIVKFEYVAMRLAAEAGLFTAPATLATIDNEDVLLVERFDRVQSSIGWHRETILSALTLLELPEAMARYASYADLAEIIRSEFSYPKDSQKELFKRLIFNVLIGNTNDHARSHSAFWDGSQLHLTPAYGICPQPLAEGQMLHAMRVTGDEYRSQLNNCLENAALFNVDMNTAIKIIHHQIRVIKAKWESICDEAQLTKTDRQQLMGNQVFNPTCVEGFEDNVRF